MSSNLSSQILQQWGGYGDWNQGGINRADELAQLLNANGITDLGQLKLTATEYGGDKVMGGWRNEGTGDGSSSVWDDTIDTGTTTEKKTRFGVMKDGVDIGYLGDVNDDGSTGKLAVDRIAKSKTMSPDLWSQLGYDGTTDRGDNGPILGWSSQGHGNTGFNLVRNPQTGDVVVVPVWNSSSQGDFAAARGVASILAMAAGAYYAPAEGVAGAMAQGGLKGAAMGIGGNMVANPNGSVDSLTKSGLAGGVTGAIGGGLSNYAQTNGWSPATTSAAKGAAGALMSGGNAGDIARGALMGGASGFTNGASITGDPTTDRALLAGGSSLIKGQGLGSALGSAATTYFGGLNSTPTKDGNVSDFTDLSNWFTNNNGNTDLTVDTSGDLWSQLYGPGSNFDNWNSNQSPTNFGDYQPVFDSQGNLTGVTGTDPNSGSGGLDLSKLLGSGGLGTLGKLALAAYGANQSKNGTSTNTRDPWAPAQPFLLNQLTAGAALQDKLQQQPFSQAQQTAYGNQGNLLDAINGQMPALLAGFGANASGANQFTRGARNQRLQPVQSFNPSAYQPAGLLGYLGSR